MRRVIWSFGSLLVLALPVFAAANQPPVLTAPTSQTVAVDQLLSVRVSAVDPENDLLRFSASPLPAGATFLALGDVNGNSALSATDAVLVLWAKVGIITLTEEQRQRADVSGDGVLSAVDVVMILQEVVGIIPRNTWFLHWRPTAQQTGPTVVSLAVQDAGGLRDAKTLTITVPVPDATAPSAPGQPTEDNPDADIDGDGAYTVSWSAASDPESGVSAYELQERAGISNPWTTLANDIAGTSFAVSGRLDRTLYVYQVRAKNGVGLWGPFSPVSDGVLVDTQPPQLSNIGVTNITAATAVIGWMTDEFSDSQVDYGVTSGYGQTASNLGVMTTHTVTLSGLTAMTTYHFRIHSTDAAAHSVASSDQMFSTASPGASVVRVSGHQLLVRKRNLDGTLGPEQPYVIRGVAWSPAGRDTNTSIADSNNANVRRLEFGKWYQTDIPLMTAMRVNTVRLFMDPGFDTTAQDVLNALYRNGIMAIVTVDDASGQSARIPQVVNLYKNHPAVLMWMVGNEWNINCYYRVPQANCTGSALSAAARDTESAAQQIKALDVAHPVSTSYGEIDIQATGKTLAVTATIVQSTCPSIDVWGLNIYRPAGGAFRLLFSQWASLTTKPMFLGEFGIDAYDVRIAAPLGQQVNEAEQAQVDQTLWDDVVRNLSARDASKVALGGTFFEWNDEWWKIAPSTSQQTGGWNSAAFPDGLASEEFFGIVDIDRRPRQAYSRLAAAFDPAYVPPAITTTLRAVSRGATADTMSFRYGFAQFFKDGALFYNKGGGGFGGRGFNVAVIDGATGAVLDAGRNFDTWGTRMTGTAMNSLIAYLAGLPNGRVVMIAVADEAGLNIDRTCTRFGFPWVESGIQALEALGSTQIRNYCFWDSWAMIAVKGEGVAPQEQVGHAVEASVQATATLP